MQISEKEIKLVLIVNGIKVEAGRQREFMLTTEF